MLGGYLQHPLAALRQRRQDRLFCGRCEPRPAETLSLCSGSREARIDPEPDHRPLELLITNRTLSETTFSLPFLTSASIRSSQIWASNRSNKSRKIFSLSGEILRASPFNLFDSAHMQIRLEDTSNHEIRSTFG